LTTREKVFGPVFHINKANSIFLSEMQKPCPVDEVHLKMLMLINEGFAHASPCTALSFDNRMSIYII
jgi:hypothetical protein